MNNRAQMSWWPLPAAIATYYLILLFIGYQIMQLPQFETLEVAKEHFILLFFAAGGILLLLGIWLAKQNAKKIRPDQ